MTDRQTTASLVDREKDRAKEQERCDEAASKGWATITLVYQAGRLKRSEVTDSIIHVAD